MRRLSASAVTAVLVALAVGDAFLPWVATGEAQRSSFRLLADLDLLGVLQGRTAAAGRVIWALLPVVGAAAVLLLTLDRRRLGAGLSAGVFVIGAGGALIVTTTDVEALVGVWIMLGLAPAGLVAAMLTAVGGFAGARRFSDGRRPGPLGPPPASRPSP